jgi:formylglycine-generating enzyme required for sulfatase activity
MVRIPAGKIAAQACPDRERICDPQDYVSRNLAIAEFRLSATEITMAQWDACVQDGGCIDEASDWAYKNRPVYPPCVEGVVCQYPYDEGWGRGDRPVIHVSWDDVQKYLAWLNRKTGGHYRLPTAEEWEYAALAGARTKFPWGAGLGKNHTNCDCCGSDWDGRQTAPVGSFKPNKFGLYDMVGNVSEWVSNCVPLRSPGKNSQECGWYIYRGGAWPFVAESLDPAGFDWANGDFRANFLGFRIAQ